MLRRRGDLQLFSMSALDVLAMSTGVFVLLLVMMMPYWRKTHDAQAALQGLAAAESTARAEAASLSTAAQRERAQADATAIEARRVAENAAAVEARAAAMLAAARVPPRPRPVAPPAPPAPPVGTPTAEQMDLVFVVDTTASMTPAIGQLRTSMRGIVRILERLVPSLRVGIVAYTDRDTGREPLSILPLTPTDQHLPRILAFLQQMQASTIGSQTIQEDAYLGLQAAAALPLRPGARQVLVLVGDAAAHDSEQGPALQFVRSFVGRAPNRSVSALFVTTPGAVANGMIDRVFFQDVAKAGGGTFTGHAGSMIQSVLLSVIVE
ncbi:MAG TPA: vWA domain-containing protein [Rhodospirillales bacterium]|nr:vWA domain-containing protein [Rhodospirillales bacterium]